MADKTMLLEGSTSQIVGTAKTLRTNKNTFQAVGNTSSGAGAATVLIEVSNNGTEYILLGTITLTLGTTKTTDGFSMDAPWAHVRANLTNITGTGAAVDVIMGS